MVPLTPPLAGLLCLLTAGACASVSANPTGAPAPVSVATSPSAGQTDDQTRRIVAAADAFLATVTPQQRQAAVFEFSDQAQRVRWSNFPDGAAVRAGVRWGDLNEDQREALMRLMGAVLSPEGVTMVRDQMAADDELRAQALEAAAGAPLASAPVPAVPAGPPPGTPPAAAPRGGTGRGRPTVNFGGDYYYVALLGTPSTTAPWMFQFGGHHLAINATVVGSQVTLSPSLTGGEPLKFSRDGRSIYIVAKEVGQSVVMLSGLTEAQRSKAIRGPNRIDLVLGPGRDSMVLQPEGLPASEMTPAQRDQFLALIQSRLGILNPDDLEAAMARVRETLDQTYLAWYGPTTEPGAAYFRIVGPRLLIEFSPQDNDGDATNHAHNMYRDPTNEYGAAWTDLTAARP